MTQFEIDIFIDTMESFNDIQEPEDVKRVYGNMTLDEAIADRKNDIASFGNILGTIATAGYDLKDIWGK